MSSTFDTVSLRVAGLKRQVLRTYESIRGSTIELETYDPSVHRPLVTFTGFPEYEEVDRYWVDAPFAFVSINYDDEEHEHLYHVVEPELNEFETTLLENLFEDVRDSLIYKHSLEQDDPEAALQREMRDLLMEYGVVVDTETFYKLFYYLNRTFRGYERIDPLMRDPYLEDISCDGYGIPIYIYHDEYTDVKTNIEFDEEELDDFVVRLAQQSGRHVSVSEPITEVTLPDGSRGELSYGDEITPRGSAFTIRRYAEDPMTPVTLVDLGTYSLDQMVYLWLAIENNKNLLFAGGTASGKTTSMNAVSMFIPPRSKVVTIEDTRELTLHHENWLANITRERVAEGTNISMFHLLRSALRHRPEYIVVGEVRGEEAMTLFQAMNTGHTTYSTMHADSVQTVINRLENDPINVPRAMIQSLDIISVQRLVRLDDERVRRAHRISEIRGIDQRTGELDYADSFSWDPFDDTFSEGDSELLDEIRADNGWSQRELLEELRNRKTVLRYLQSQEVENYRTFTAIINEYYADPDGVLDRIDRRWDEEGAVTTDLG